MSEMNDLDLRRKRYNEWMIFLVPFFVFCFLNLVKLFIESHQQCYKTRDVKEGS